MPGNGPVPKRDDERLRRNKPVIETDTVTMIGAVEIPELGLDDPHPLIVDFYEAMKKSGQSKYYEPSDWALARFALHFANDLVKSGKPSSMLLQQVTSMLSDLLVAEGQRRRVRMEIEREAASAKVIDMSEYFRQRLGSRSGEAD